jgi:ubiquinone/menaquinone biosynthesis C-methylase UbiE
VTLTDLSPRMLDVARQQARRTEVDNVEFAVADAHDLPFDDVSFDLVASRFGVMYFVEPQRAFAECLRVLRPGGRVVFVAWGPLEELDNLRLALAPFARRIELPQRHPDQPHPLRYSSRGRLGRELEQAGFAAVEEEWRTVPWPWPGTPEELWRRFYEGAVPFQPIVDSLDADERKAAISEAIESFQEHYDGETVRLHVTIVVVSATRR